MSFGIIRSGEFHFNFNKMHAHKWRKTFDYPPGGGIAGRKEREEIVTRYLLAETKEGLCLVLLDCVKRTTLPLESFMHPENLDEVMKAWADWVFERDLLRG